MNNRVQAALLAAVLAVAVGGVAAWTASRPDGRLHVTVLSVGSAPAVLVQAQGEAALVDGGASPSLLVSALGRVLPPLTTRIDMVVVTGGEQAAVAGLSGLIGHYTVATVLAPAQLTPGAATVVESLVAAGSDMVSIGDTQWTEADLVWRCLRYHAQATDRDDCVIVVGDAASSVMVLGAAGTADQDELAAMYPTTRATVVVTPPGGAMSTALLAVTGPRAIAVPVAAGSATVPAPSGVTEQRTGADGDIAFTDGVPDGG